jgi:hypothetical protein
MIKINRNIDLIIIHDFMFDVVITTYYDLLPYLFTYYDLRLITDSKSKSNFGLTYVLYIYEL